MDRDGIIDTPPHGHLAARVCIQLGHRLGVLALFGFLGTLGAMWAAKPFHWPLAIAMGTADLGGCAALLALSMPACRRPFWREAVGVLAVNGLLVLLSLPLMLVDRIDVIRTAVQEQLKPLPTLPQS